jgi:hypothetical protein
MSRTSVGEEAILIASDTNAACDYLKKRAEKRDFWDLITKETEATLLRRNERLLDLTLAEFCLYPETAQALFTRDPNDAPIRSLVLTNEFVSHDSLEWFPECLFGGEEGLLTYLRTVTPNERALLFSHPSLHYSFLEQFLSLDKPWQVMDPEQRLWALHNLGHNERLRAKRSTADFDDGWDWYTAGKPAAAAWQLIERLDVSKATAHALATLLRDLPNDCSKTDGIQTSLGRWQPLTAEEKEKEAAENLKGRLSHHQEVRQAGARLLASSKSELKQFLESEDLAQRCGAYEVGRFKPEEMKAAVERDGDHARLYLVRNEHLWRTDRLRDAMRDVLNGGDRENASWEYRRRDSHYRKTFPLWFKDEDLPAEPDERPIRDASIADVAAAVASDPAITQVTARMAALEKRQQVLLWMVLAVLVVLFWRR